MALRHIEQSQLKPLTIHKAKDLLRKLLTEYRGGSDECLPIFKKLGIEQKEDIITTDEACTLLRNIDKFTEYEVTCLLNKLDPNHRHVIVEPTTSYRYNDRHD